MLNLKKKEINLTLHDLFLISSQKLRNAGIPTPELDTRVLFAHALSLTVEDVIKKGSEFVFFAEEKEIEKLIERRKNHEPVAKIIGRKEFYGFDFKTNKHTLDPRPETELLIEEAFSLYPDKNSEIKIADFGTGTGCIPVTLLKNYIKASAIAVDISKEALIVAAENSRKHSVFDRIKLIQADWREKNFKQSFTEKFDLIVSNPPYIKKEEIESLEPDNRFDPTFALDGGFDGLECYRVLLPIFNELISDKGFVLLEIGDKQKNDVIEIANQYGFNAVRTAKDLANIVRCIVLTK